MSLLTGSHSLEAGHGGSHSLLSQHLISNSNGCHLSCFGLQWMVFSGLKSRRKRLMLCFLLSQGSICSYPQQDGWLKDICQDFSFFFFSDDFLKSPQKFLLQLFDRLSLTNTHNPLAGRTGICRPGTYLSPGCGLVSSTN